MAGNGVDVDPDVLDDASAAIAEVVDEHDGHAVRLGGGDYGHSGLAGAVGTFVEQVDLASQQHVTVLDVLAVELSTQAESYRAVDERAQTMFTGLTPDGLFQSPITLPDWYTPPTTPTFPAPTRPGDPQ
jgi:Ethanolamine utilization protein EutJ (predicted chaperonin)